MRSEPRYLEFQPHRAEEVVAVLTEMAETGRGWVNFEPAVHVDDVPAEGSGAFSLFSGRGPVVPLGTWTPGSLSRRGRREPAMLGLQHPAGSKAKPLLAELGNAVPEGWAVVQDHVRKGLVVAVPGDVGADVALEWLLRAARLLSTIPLTGGWRAAVYPG
ncbi:MAG TPA: hypothetical protein VGV86_14960 [Acidimicrobiales bacterium]|nr:hypothetical protein [Acidimicrobiales bacterium]